MRIGLDFDNTIIRYDDVFQAAAIERGLVSAKFCGTKQQVRDAIRSLPGGDRQWQALQGYVYGKGIQGATLFAGLDGFLRRARVHGDTIFVVSHKTEYGHFDPDRVSLRGAAIQWMEGRGFFGEQGFGLQRSNVHFVSSRSEKMNRIGELACDVFVDDLEEVLSDSEFPPFVRRILLSEHAERRDDMPYEICRDWAAVQKTVFLIDRDLRVSSAMNIARKLVGGPVRGVSRIAGGRNSRVYRIDAGDQVFALKQYPSLEDDPRDRLGIETAALKWMHQQGLDMVPRLLATDRDSNSVLLSWVEGSQVRLVGPSDIDQAVDFLGALEALRDSTKFPATCLAAEACLSGVEIERQIAKRFADLYRLEERPLQAFLEEEFAGALEDCLSRTRKVLLSAGLSFEVELAHEQRSLVPSDFGFHNALRDERGRLTFIDFEYFGWDDPVKLTADMLLHPGTPVADELRSRFKGAAQKLYGDDPDFTARLEAFHPLFGLRWVLILLNEFHPERWRRRILAGTSNGWAEAKDRQLRAARAMLMNLRA